MDSSFLLRLQSIHRSSFLNHENSEEDQLRVHVHTINEPHPDIVELLRVSGFYQASQIGRVSIDAALITALVERWRPETHTFHLSWGECTVTLEDVALQLGLRVNVNPVTGPSFFNWETMCATLLGVVPPQNEMKGSSVKLRWLQTTFKDLPAGASLLQIQQFCRAYILRLIGGVLMPDKSGNRVHLMYLQFLEDFEHTGRYSWGSACLATLYREMCRATDITSYGSSAIGGCLWLLQSWAWYRLPSIAPRVNCSPSYPLARRWSGNLGFVGTPRGSLRTYRDRLDHLEIDKFLWMPYTNADIHSCLPTEAFEDANVWNASTVLMCFSIIEWHHTDRVRRQFGFQQGVPQPPVNLDDVHKVDMRGNQYENWAEKHKTWLSYWRDRQYYVLQGPPADNDLLPTEQYMCWFCDNSRRFLTRPSDLEDPRRRAIPIANSINVTQKFNFPTLSRRRGGHRKRTKRMAHVEEDHTQQEPSKLARISFCHSPPQ